MLTYRSSQDGVPLLPALVLRVLLGRTTCSASAARVVFGRAGRRARARRVAGAGRGHGASAQRREGGPTAGPGVSIVSKY